MNDHTILVNDHSINLRSCTNPRVRDGEVVIIVRDGLRALPRSLKLADAVRTNLEDVETCIRRLLPTGDVVSNCRHCLICTQGNYGCKKVSARESASPSDSLSDQTGILRLVSLGFYVVDATLLQDCAVGGDHVLTVLAGELIS